MSRRNFINKVQVCRETLLRRRLDSHITIGYRIRFWIRNNLQSRIRIRKWSFRVHNTATYSNFVQSFHMPDFLASCRPSTGMKKNVVSSPESEYLVRYLDAGGIGPDANVKLCLLVRTFPEMFSISYLYTQDLTSHLRPVPKIKNLRLRMQIWRI
jgi:hypothetical protein